MVHGKYKDAQPISERMKCMLTTHTHTEGEREREELSKKLELSITLWF